MKSFRIFLILFNKFRLGTAIDVKPVVSDFERISLYMRRGSKENGIFDRELKKESKSSEKKVYFWGFLTCFIVYINSLVLYLWSKLKGVYIYIYFMKKEFFKEREDTSSRSWLNIAVYFFLFPYFWISNGKKLIKSSFMSEFPYKGCSDFKSSRDSSNTQLSTQLFASQAENSLLFHNQDSSSNLIHFMLYNKDVIDKDNLKSPSSSMIIDMSQWSEFLHTSIPRPLFPKTLMPKTLILDLDETLIHSLVKGGRIATGHMVEVMLGKHAILYYVHKRPHCDNFLKKVSKWYNVVIFTASVQEYADPVIDWLEKDRKFFKARFYRQHCTFRNGSYIKDLSIVHPDLSKVIIIDNSPISYSMHEDNAIPIEGWISDPSDKNLLHLIPFLYGLRYVLDVRALLGLRTGVFSFNTP
ncbi:hypothetical protein PNEG_01560 [Pneumocystis murina B123]|uniref:FCP1 homology domain-containing protein n=1 Tax=Pneumocystis murina (strain B123) TaxID=1069680 RepID=M7PIN3_PNEMU|nr:hypothetical protein PNEG_01560 [Pneumocystis murina B123]EMR10299.1 hypothetical protein PNEG_01560 [Pneumocystis murina B123]